MAEDDVFKKWLKDSRTIFCVKDIHGKVIYQNAASKSNCISNSELKSGKTCTAGCMDYLKDGKVSKKRSMLLESRSVYDAYYDIHMIRDEHSVVTILHPASKGSFSKEMEVLKRANLTKREFEVAQLMIRGFTNIEISKMLHISKSTLKTHINRIYHKCAELRILITHEDSGVRKVKTL